MGELAVPDDEDDDEDEDEREEEEEEKGDDCMSLWMAPRPSCRTRRGVRLSSNSM